MLKGLRWGGSAFIAFWAGAAPALAQDAPFTAPQAAHGEAIYTQNCAACHGASLAGGNAPALLGPAFARHWARPAKSVSDLLGYVQANMPLNAAGSLPRGDTEAVIAFVLARNGVHAGARTLSADDASLKTAGLHVDETAPAPVATANFVTGPKGAAPSGSGPAQAALTNAAADGADWLTTNRDYAGTRYSPLTQINTSNAARLQKSCSFDIGGHAALQTSPVAYRGVLYFTSGASTFAIGGADCKLRWRHDWPVSAPDARIVSRGLALKDGRVLRATEDGFLVALDAETGTLLWARRISDSAHGEFITMPPLVFDDLVFAGPAVSEFGVRGWIAAFHIADGTQAWRFNTVPAKGEPGAETWAQNAGVPLGGGTIWTALSLDPATETLFVSAGNPAPDLAVETRGGGANLYTNSVIALHARTGKLDWYDQIVPHDDHDWDINHAGPLYHATIDGKPRDLIATAGKDGMLRVLDRATRKMMFTAQLTTISNASTPVTTAGGDVCPGALGGVQWNGPAYSPSANLLVTPAVDWCSHYALDAKVRFVPAQYYMGGAVTMKPDASGWLTAVDATTGAVKWKLHSTRPMVAAVTPTAGGLIFAGELTGDLLALDAASGAVLSRLPVGGPLGAGIVTYQSAGQQYVAAVSGTPSGFWGSPKAPPGGPAITVFGMK